jgi:type II secretory ATPase GspE/PulE/Tfp pilus assembly ATPase PilB-like protein
MPDQLPSIEDLLKQAAPAAAQAPQATDAPVEAPQAAEVAPEATNTALTDRMSSIEAKGVESRAQVQAVAINLPYINLKGFPISPDALEVLPIERAQELKAICFLFTGSELRLAAVDPQSEAIKSLLHELTERFKAHGGLYLTTQQSLDEGFKMYGRLPKTRQIVKGVQIKEEELARYQEQMASMKDIADVISKANVTDILSIVVAAAVKLKSSDIHIEAEESDIKVRFRVDGMLQDIASINKSEWKKIINRIKLIAGLKMNITDKPQDGRFTIFQKQKKIDVRTSTIPTSAGESVVMRLLNPDSISLDLKDLGFRENALKKLMTVIEKPNGMIVTTGPTGSGKTTTLYAILQHLNSDTVKILTLEDPVEYKLEGINQSQIDSSKEYTFAKGLRSILRQDPDIVMVGEIRDLETAETAIQAALTGHLLLSTIHTNDAAGAIPRFVSMGVKPFLLAPAVNAIMGQRLARRLCSECKQEAVPSGELLERTKQLISEIPENSGEKPAGTDWKFYGPKGCETCTNTGYKGRVGLYEILLKDQAVEKFMLEGEISEFAVREVAKQQGMITMAQDGILKAIEGLTSLEEVQRITGL